ncbi:hypothetical protein F4809DRAFT_608795, partial [Biscogniauxia mediterranea]
MSLRSKRRFTGFFLFLFLFLLCFSPCSSFLTLLSRSRDVALPARCSYIISERRSLISELHGPHAGFHPSARYLPIL